MHNPRLHCIVRLWLFLYHVHCTTVIMERLLLLYIICGDMLYYCLLASSFMHLSVSLVVVCASGTYIHR